MTTLVRLLAAIESGEEARFSSEVEPSMLPAPRPGYGHPFSLLCQCPHCDEHWVAR